MWLRGLKIPKTSPQMVRTKIVHTSGNFFDFRGVDSFVFLVSENIFNPCSNIEFNTQNPNPILKITISLTKTPKNQNTFEVLQILRKIEKIKKRKRKFVFRNLYKLYNLYVVFFGCFGNICIFFFGGGVYLYILHV